MVRRELASRPCRTPLLCSHLVKVLKQYLSFLVPCTPGGDGKEHRVSLACFCEKQTTCLYVKNTG